MEPRTVPDSRFGDSFSGFHERELPRRVAHADSAPSLPFISSAPWWLGTVAIGLAWRLVDIAFIFTRSGVASTGVWKGASTCVAADAGARGVVGSCAGASRAVRNSRCAYALLSQLKDSSRSP